MNFIFPFCKKKLRQIIFSLLPLFFLPLLSSAQTYPVQLTTQLVPPFSGYIPDYAAPGNESLRALILFTDFSHATYDVKLKIKIQGQGITIQSHPYYFSGPITVEPGVPLLLSGTDFAGLLNENNLDFSGITRADYDAHKVLPEGFYTITVTAYDFLNPIPIQVSNEGMIQAWMVLNDPPFLNLPSCNSSIIPTSPQQITFSWASMNLSAPFSLGTEYTFELWEIFPANMNAGNIVASTAPLYSITTSQTILNYGIAEPPLIAGREYVWRVRARDLENRELFRNNGYSSLCTFQYGNNLDLFGNIGNITLHAQTITHRQAHCWWDSISIYSSYRFEFRKVGGENWFPFYTDHASLNIPDLEPNTDYEAHVTGITSDAEGPQSNVATWHTPLQPILNCGETSPPPAQQNFRPLTQASTGMIWQVGQFEMEVTSLNGNSNLQGWYSGLGKIVMPLGWTVNCSFQNVKIGEDHVMYAGEVRAITEGITQWISQYNISGNVSPEIQVNSNIDNASQIIVNELGGEITIGGNTYSYDSQDGTAIEDSDGSLWIVTTDGNVIYGGESGHVFNPLPPATINTNYGTAIFSAPDELYGFDKFEIPAWRNYYDDVTDLKDNSQNPVSWKSVQSKKYDVVKVLLSPLQGISVDSIFFYTPTGTIYAGHGTGNLKTIYIVGGENKDRQDLYAGFYSSNHQIINIGKLNIVSFQKEEKKIKLVPLAASANSIPGIPQSIAAQLQHSLDSIYAGGIIKWTVETENQALTPTGWDNNHDNKLDVRSSGLAHYSDEMNSINTALRYQSYYSPNDYFIFVSSIPPDSSWNELQGEMPRGKNIGYVFENATDPNFEKTIAHEIAHGCFALEHSFNGNAPAPKGTTDNLLDYNNGKRLVQFQWAWMHNPAGWTGLDNDENSASVFVDMRELLPFLNSDSTSFTFYSPSGLPFTIPMNGLSQVVFSYGDEYNFSACGNDGSYNENPVGSLISFTLNGNKYVCYSQCSGNQFLGYHVSNSAVVFRDSISHRLSPSAGIIGYPCVNVGSIVFVVAKQAFVNATTISATDYLASGTIVQHVIQPNFLLQSNPTTTEINATIYPPYSSDAENYLISNLSAASCGSDLSSYVLTYAYQINKYPDVYNCCFKETEITSQNIDPFTSYLPLPNAYQSIPESTPFEQQEQEIKLLQEKTRVKFHYIDEKRKNINAEILAIANPSVMGDTLFSALDYTCVWNVLYASTRLHAINVLCESSVNGDWLGAGNNYESLVNRLLCFSKDPIQQDSLLNALHENNNQLLQLLWEKLDLDGLDEFVNTITGWIASRATDKPTFQSIHDEAYIGNSNSTQSSPRYFEFYRWATEFNSEHYQFTSQNHFVDGSANIYLETTYDPDENDNQPGGYLATTLDAFDWIAVHIGDDMPSLGLKKNQNLVVPMIWAKWLSTRISTNDVSRSLSLIGQVVLFLATDYAGNALFEGAFTATEVGTSMTAKMVGQDLKAFVLQNATEGEIASAEIGADGGWVFRDLRWVDNNESGYVTVGKLNGVKYYNPENQLVEGDLEVVINSATKVCKVRRPAVRLNFQTSWLPDRVIEGNLDNPVGALGCYNKTNIPGYGNVSDTKNMLEQLQYPKTNDFSYSCGGFKLLNSLDGTFTTLDEFWVNYNVPFLQSLTDAKADIYILSDPENEYLLYQTEMDEASGQLKFKTDENTARIRTSFGREVEFMNNEVTLGKYRFNSVAGKYEYIGQ